MATQTYADAAQLANRHIAAIQQQIEMFTHPPEWAAWQPKFRYRCAVARKIIDRAIRASQVFGNGDAVAAQRLAKSETPEELLALSEWEPNIVKSLLFTAQDAGMLKLWEKYKIAYSIDRDLWHELGDANDDTVVPLGILGRLPHPNPFVALPEPILLPTKDGLVQHIEGFFVTGRFGVSEHGYLLTSTERTPHNMALLTCSTIRHSNGVHARNIEGNLDFAWVRLSITDDTTVGELLKKIREGFQSTTTGLDWQREVEMSLRRSVAILLYLCASNADLEKMPKPPPQRVKPGKSRRTNAVQVVKVGWRLGTALRAYHTQSESVRGVSTGRKVRPHLRRAHFHTYRTGPGRAQTEIKWVSAVPVNFTRDADVPTVIPAGKR